MQSQNAWIFLGLVMALVVGLSLVMVAIPSIVSRLLGLKRTNAFKLETYECGISPTGSARVRFSVKFYLVAMLFVLFDIEAIFLYPWATVHRWLGVFGLVEMGIFVVLLLVGYVYILKRGGFRWES